MSIGLGGPCERDRGLQGCGVVWAVSCWFDAEGVLAIVGLFAPEEDKLICAPGLRKGSPVVEEPEGAPVAMVEDLEVVVGIVGASTCCKRASVLVLRRILHRHKLAYNYGSQPISISTQTKLYQPWLMRSKDT